MGLSQRTPRWSTGASLIAVLVAAAPSAVVAAGPVVEDPNAADQIVVTGRRDPHGADVQATPAAITALSGEKLAALGVTNIRELGAITPNLYQTRTAVSYLNTNIFIRGVGEPDAQGEPSVGIYIDGIYVPKNAGAQQELLDVQQIDIYRGPQGQAFGHSAEAGALVISTITPDETPRLKLQAAYGTFNDARLGLAASGPLAGNLFGGIALSYHRRDGFNRNVTLGRDTNDVDYFAGRGKLRLIAGDDVDVTLSLQGVRDRSTARGVQNLNFGDRDAHNQIFPGNVFDQLAATLNASWKIDDRLTLRSITGAYGFNQTGFFDNSGDFYGRGSQWVHYRDRTYQQELRLAGDFGRLDFTTGLYLYRETWFTNRRANIGANASTNPANVRYAPIYSLIRQNTTNVAGYGEAHWKAADRVRLTAGLRYNWERHTNDNQLFYPSGVDPVTRQSNAYNFLSVLFSAPGQLAWARSAQGSWGTWAPKGSIDVTWRPGLLQYVTISQGTKSAGFDYRAQTPSVPSQAELSYAPERVTNYETGLKTEWLNGRLRLNVAGFYMRFDDIQLTTTDPSTPAQISRRFNAGQGSTRGAEIEAVLRPTGTLQFDLSGSYLDARLDVFRGRVVAPSVLPSGQVQRTVPFAGAQLPYSPKWQGRFAGSWTLPIGTPGAWVAQASVQYQAHAFTDATNNFTTRIPAQTFVDGQIGYTTEGGHWSIVGSVKNLFNKHYPQGIGYALDNDPASPTFRGAGYRTVNYSDPRTLLLTLTYKR